MTQRRCTLPEFATRGHFQANLPELDTSGILPIIECWLWEPQASKFVVVVGLWYQTGLKFLLWWWQLATAYVCIMFSILMFLNNKPSCWTKNSSQRSCNVMNFDEVGRGTKWDCFRSTSLNPFIAAIKIPISPCPAYAHARLEDMLTLQPLSYRQLKSYLKHMAHGKFSNFQKIRLYFHQIYTIKMISFLHKMPISTFLHQIYWLFFSLMKFGY